MSLYTLAGVDGIVACAAGPRAALNDVAGKGTECGEEPALMLFNSMPLERKGADAEG